MTARLVRSPLARPLLARTLTVAALPLVAGAWLAGTSIPAVAADDTATSDDWSGGPSYSYFDVGYQWTDVNYAVKQEGGQHEGLKLNGSVGLANFGRIGLHLFGEFFDGDFSGIRTPCNGGEDIHGEPITSSSRDRDSQSLAGGLGLSYAVTESTDLVARAAYVDISKFQIPDDSCNMVDGDDTGYFVEGMVRSLMSERVELEAGVRYSDIDDSDISNTDVVLGIGYFVTDYLTLRARGVVFDDDTGVELGVRLYFGRFTGRDNVF